MALADNLKYVTERIHIACERSGRSAGQIRTLAVTKTVPPPRIREAAALGLLLMGENRVQEAAEKQAHLTDLPVTWHFIGHLQTNKVKRALELFALIQSVDSLNLGQEINKIAGALGRVVPVFMEVNTSGETSKFGIPPDQAEDLAGALGQMPHLRLTGLMTIGALATDTSRIRSCFIALRQLQERLNASGLSIDHLSMGMSDDFEIAIEEGATLIRLGRALFGERL